MNTYNFDDFEIQKQIAEFLQYHGLLPVDSKDRNIICDSKIHRYKIDGDKRSDKSGAYCFYTNHWPEGWVKNWRTGNIINWSFNRDNLDEQGKAFFTDKKFKEAQEKSKQYRKELEKKLQQDAAEASEKARILFETLPEAEQHPYLTKKNVKSYGLHYQKSTKSLAVPLKDIEGRFISLQWIDTEGNKKFFPGAPTKGVFFAFNLDDKNVNKPILIGEGYATMATVFDVTECPCIAAMNCHNLLPVAEAVQNKYPDRKIIIVADNDTKTKGNPGLTCANEAVKKFKLDGIIYPQFSRKESGSDWNDFAGLHGNEAIRDIFLDKIYLFCAEKEIQPVLARVEHVNAQLLRTKKFMPPKYAVEGIIPAGLTVLAGGPKVGKSILCLHLALAIATGGYALGKIKVEQGDVLYLALEDTQMNIQHRILESAIDDNDDISRLEIAPKVPKQHEGGLDYIKWWLENHEQARLVIIDTLQKFRKPLSTGAAMYGEDYEVVSEIKNLADNFAVAVMLVHHLKKAMEGDWLNEISGSQGIAGAADTILSLKRSRSSKNGLLHITGRNVEEKDYNVQLDNFGWVLLGEVMEQEEQISEATQEILDYLEEHGATGVKTIASDLNVPYKTMSKRLTRLAEKGIIEKNFYGNYSLSNNEE